MSKTVMENGLKYLRSLFPDISADEEFKDAIKSGVLLCKLANLVKPNSIVKIDERPIPFVFCANIVEFNNFCRELKLSDSQLPAPVSLVEGELSAIQNVISICYFFSEKFGVGKWIGEACGSTEVEENVSECTDDSPNKKELYLEIVEEQSNKQFTEQHEVGKIDKSKFEKADNADTLREIPEKINIEERERLIEMEEESKIRTDVIEKTDDFHVDKERLELNEALKSPPVSSDKASKETEESNTIGYNERVEEEENEKKVEKMEKKEKDKKEKDKADKPKKEKDKGEKKSKKGDNDSSSVNTKEKEKKDKAEKKVKAKDGGKVSTSKDKVLKSGKILVETDFTAPNPDCATYAAKVCITGNPQTGKAHLLYRLANGNVMDKFEPINKANLVFQDEIDDEEVNISLDMMISAKEEDLEWADIVVITFSMNDESTFHTLLDHVEKLESFKSNKFVVICGCKADSDGLIDPQTLQSTIYLDSGFKGFKFVRTSSKTGLGISKVFSAVDWAEDWMQKK